MANTYLTISDITREALVVLHEKCTFLSTVNRQYDSRFAKDGYKIGSSLQIRLPNQYTVRTGKTMNAQNSTQRSVTLNLATQKGVDMDGFSSADRALKIDKFSENYIEPAMAVLASDIESTVLQSVTKDVYNTVGTAGTTPATMTVFGNARAKLNQYLAPKDIKNRHVQISSLTMASMVNAYNALFHKGSAIDKQYVEGRISGEPHSGFNWYENERVLSLTNGADHTTVTVNDASIAPTATARFTTAGANVQLWGRSSPSQARALKLFTLKPSSHTRMTSSLLLPRLMVMTGRFPRHFTLPDHCRTSTRCLVTVLRSPLVGTASTTYPYDLAYHRDAFAFVTADLPVPKGVDEAYRDMLDGLSMRIVQDYDMKNDEFGCRIDILFGYLTMRPQLATRIIG